MPQCNIDNAFYFWMDAYTQWRFLARCKLHMRQLSNREKKYAARALANAIGWASR